MERFSNVKCLFKTRSHWKKYFERKNLLTPFCSLCVNLPTVKTWGQSDKFHMSFSSLQCPLQVKKLIRENISFLHWRFNLYHYFNWKIKIWRKLPIWRYMVILWVPRAWQATFVHGHILWSLNANSDSVHQQNVHVLSYLIWHDSWWGSITLWLFHIENEYDQKCKQQNCRVGKQAFDKEMVLSPSLKAIKL